MRKTLKYLLVFIAFFMSSAIFSSGLYANCSCNDDDCYYDYDWDNCKTYFFHEVCAVVCDEGDG